MFVLSIFPGIDLFGRGFEAEGYCVVRGPDLIWGGDIRNFHPPTDKFDGVIGGPPCPDFSRGRNGLEPTGDGVAMLMEFVRCVEEAQPDWWMLENVERAPDVYVEGYTHQRLDVWAHEFGMTQRRLRHIQFGDRHGRALLLDRQSAEHRNADLTPTITASDTTTPWTEFVTAQGLPADFDLPTWTGAAKRRAVGNGVPIPMARALAAAIRDNLSANPDRRPCICGCGRATKTPDTMYSPEGACRTREYRRRHAPDVSVPGAVTPAR